MQKFLDISGLTRLWAKIKAYVASVLPSKTSDLINDDNFVDTATDQLVHYYKKSQTYSKTEVDALVADVDCTEYVAVDTLPTASATTKGKFYLYGGHRYITQGDGPYTWHDLGPYDIDLAGYIKEEDLEEALEDRPAFELVTETQMQDLIEQGTWEPGVLYYSVEED